MTKPSPAVTRTTKTKATMKRNIVKIPGLEWPGTEWDTCDAWYEGKVVREDGDTIHLQFDDCDDALPFRRDILESYEIMYTNFCIDVLCDAMTLDAM